MQAHVWGVVVVDAVIDEHGNVVGARAVSGHPLLVAAALKAVLQWKYEPTLLNGTPVAVEMEVTVHFNH
jgi:protein TonB